MATDKRRLRMTDLAGNERAQGASAARRHIEELDQNDQIIALLTHQNALLQYMAERMQGIAPTPPPSA